MPYYQRQWNVLLGDQAPKQTKKLRTTPVIENGISSSEPCEPKQLLADLNKVKSVQNALKSSITELQNCKGADLIKESDNYLNYEVNREQVIFKGLHSQINLCSNSTDYGQLAMIAREFKPTSLLNAEDPYLKLLRHIGKSHSAIIQTMDIFVDNKRHIFLFQEFANRGNGMAFIKQGNQATEQQIHSWSQIIYSALDYLGEKAISHRSLHPKHIMLKDGPNGELTVKLGGFRDSCIYWDPVANDIIDQPCKAMIDVKHYYFHAPESFGQEGEVFDPIMADVWSFGCTMFFLVSRQYPFNAAEPEQNLDGEIRNTLAACTNLSDDGKYFLYGLLRTNTLYRTEFDAIPMDPWIRGA